MVANAENHPCETREATAETIDNGSNASPGTRAGDRNTRLIVTHTAVVGARRR